MKNNELKKNQNIIQKLFGKSLTSKNKNVIKPKTPHKQAKTKQLNNSNFFYKLNTTRDVFKTIDSNDTSPYNDLGNYAQKTQKNMLKNIKNKNEIPTKNVLIKKNNINLRNKKMRDFYKEMQNDLNNYVNSRNIVNSKSVVARKNQNFTTGKTYNPSDKKISNFHSPLSLDKYDRNKMNNSINYNKERTNKQLRRSFDGPNYLKKSIVNTKLKIRLKKNLPSDNQSTLLCSLINNCHKNNKNINKKTFESNLHNVSNINIYNSNINCNSNNISINGNNNNHLISKATIDSYEKRRRLRTGLMNNMVNLDKINKNVTIDGYRNRGNFPEQKKNIKNQKISEKPKNSPKSVKVRKIRNSFAINNNDKCNINKNDKQKIKIQRFNKNKTNNKVFPNNKNKTINCGKNKNTNNNSMKKIIRNKNYIISIDDIDHDDLKKNFITENNNQNLLNLDETNEILSDDNSINHTDRTNSNKSDIFEGGTIGPYNKEKLYEIFQVISDVKVKSFIEYEEDKKNKLQENNNNNNRNVEDINNNLNINEVIMSNNKTIDNQNKFIEDRDEYNIVLKKTLSKDRFSFRPTNNDSNDTLQDTYMKNANKSTVLNKKDFMNYIGNSSRKEKRDNWIQKALNNYRATKNANSMKSSKNIAPNKIVKLIPNDFQLKKK